MIGTPSYEKCLSFINCRFQEGDKLPPMETSQPRPTITVSRQSGCGAHAIAEMLAQLLQQRSPCKCEWAVFDHNLVDQVLVDHHLPKRLAHYMTEGRASELSSMVEEVLGLHPSSWTLFEQTVETILHLGELGRVVMVGRGSNVITGKLPNAFHVRLVGSMEKRIEHVSAQLAIGPKEARDLIVTEDRGRKEFLKKHFRADIDDPLLYHLIINTDRMSSEVSARLIADAVMARFGSVCWDKIPA